MKCLFVRSPPLGWKDECAPHVDTITREINSHRATHVSQGRRIRASPSSLHSIQERPGRSTASNNHYPFTPTAPSHDSPPSSAISFLSSLNLYLRLSLLAKEFLHPALDSPRSNHTMDRI